MKPRERERQTPEPEPIKGTTGEQVGNPKKPPAKPPASEADDATGRYQKKTGQIKRDFSR